MQVSCKRAGLNPVEQLKLQGWRRTEAGGIPGVAVKCVDIRKNTGGEGGLLVTN